MRTQQPKSTINVVSTHFAFRKSGGSVKWALYTLISVRAAVAVE